jgi:glucose/arabinose dehydrogenase
VDYVFGGKDGTFDSNFSKVTTPPMETKYMQLQFWVRQTLAKDSSYLIDNMNIWQSIQNVSTSIANNEIETPLNISDNSDSYNTVKKSQQDSLESIMSICGSEKQDYTIDEKINYEYKDWKNSTVIINITTVVDVRDSNGSLVASNAGTNAGYVTSEGLPLDDKIRIPLTCKSTNIPDQEFLIQQEIRFTNESVSISGTTVSNYDQLIVNDPNLKSELIVQNLDFPTSMAFLGKDILVLEKDKGTVQMIVNGKMLDKALIDMNVYNIGEMGLSGISVINNTMKPPYVYLYLTESEKGDTTIKSESLGIRIYRFEFVNNQLVKPNLLLNLPLNLTDLHVGGKMVIGPDGNVYVGIGDIGQGNKRTATKAQNNKTGSEPNGAGGILRFTQDGKPLEKSVIDDQYPLNLYYAYGIRNTFGMDFDPVTGILWDTENGNVNGDEINRVEPGFNSGWSLVEGMSKMNDESSISEMVDLNGKGKYNDPQFGWYMNYGPVGPTALTFLDSK